MPKPAVRTQFTLRIAILLAASMSARAAQAQQAAAPAFPPDSAVLAIIKRRVEEKPSRGIIVGMRQRTGRPRIVTFGAPGKGQPPLDVNAVFEIGSISKV